MSFNSSLNVYPDPFSTGITEHHDWVFYREIFLSGVLVLVSGGCLHARSRALRRAALWISSLSSSFYKTHPSPHGGPTLWHHLILIIFQALLPTRVNIPSKIKSAPYKKVQTWTEWRKFKGLKQRAWELREGGRLTAEAKPRKQTKPTKSGSMLQNIGGNFDLNLITGAGEREMAQC